jgi:endonuclease/exonuclease/phosphatase family metal-dependent hydrolase
VRVVSWNIEHGREVERAAEDLSTIDELCDADLLLVQEMDDVGTHLLAELLGMNVGYVEGHPHRSTGRPFGNAVLSPWAVSDVTSVPMPFTATVGGHPRAAIGATVDVDGDPVSAYSIHVETVLLSLSRRAAQVAAVAAHTTARDDGVVIIGGDFNTATSRSVAVFDRVMADYGVDRLDSGSQPTFDRFGRSFPLDHLYGRGVEVVSAGTAHEAGTSDHRPIWATVRRTPS